VLFEDVVNSLKNGFSFAMKIGKNHGINENVKYLPPLNFKRVFKKNYIILCGYVARFE
jgi:hypothetical protein